MDLDRVLPVVYALLAIAAAGRGSLQLATEASRAPLAYTLSAVAGLVYIAGVAALSRAEKSRRALRWAMSLCTIELTGVIGVGLFSLLDSARFPDDTVWSDFGAGYGFIPLALPVDTCPKRPPAPGSNWSREIGLSHGREKPAVQPRNISRAGYGLRPGDRLIGGPPCTPFSKSGFWLEWKREGLDPDALLLQAYTRVLAQARPHRFILESAPTCDRLVRT
jgi:C-5 cytosine-specific DNA methylase